MASKKRYTSWRAVARGRVVVQKPMGAVVVLTLPVNPGFHDPNEIDEQRGVPYDPEDPSQEQDLAQEAPTRRLWDEIQPPNLGTWVRSQAARAGGIPALARQLVAMERDPLRPMTDERNMTRKLEEWRQGKYKKATGRNARRVAFLQIRTSQLLAAVTGHWTIHQDNAEVELFRTFTTNVKDPDTAERFQRALERTLTDPQQPGSAIIAIVREAASETVSYDVDLDVLNGVRLQAQPRTERRQTSQGRK